MVLQGGELIAQGENAAIEIAAPLVSVNPGSAVTAGAEFDTSSGTPVAVQTGANASVTLRSANEMVIAGSVTASGELVIESGTPITPSIEDANSSFTIFNKAGFFADLASFDPNHYLLAQDTFSLLVSGTITSLATAQTLELSSTDEIIIRGNIDVLGADSDLIIQSDKWLFIEGALTVSDTIEVYGGVSTDGTDQGGADSNGSSIYINQGTRLITLQDGSRIQLIGSKDVDISGELIAAGEVGANGIIPLGPDSTVEVTAGEQAYVDAALFATKSVQVNGGIAQASDRDLSVLVSTAGSLNAYGLTTDGTGGLARIDSPGNIEMSGTIIAGGVPSLTLDTDGNISERIVDFSNSERSNVHLEAAGQVYLGRTEVNSTGASTQNGSSIRVNGDITVIAGTHSSGTGIYLEGPGEVLTVANDGSILFDSDQDVFIEGLILAGGSITTFTTKTASTLVEKLSTMLATLP